MNIRSFLKSFFFFSGGGLLFKSIITLKMGKDLIFIVLKWSVKQKLKAYFAHTQKKNQNLKGSTSSHFTGRKNRIFEKIHTAHHQSTVWAGSATRRSCTSPIGWRQRKQMTQHGSFIIMLSVSRCWQKVQGHSEEMELFAAAVLLFLLVGRSTSYDDGRFSFCFRVIY